MSSYYISRTRSVNRTLAEHLLKGQDVAGVNGYIDGFNLYYGALKQTAYKWLDLSPNCHTLLRSNTIPSPSAAQYAYFRSRSWFVHPCIEDNSESHN
jgi:hypothetical protein